ncbi:hypothetical protein [Methanomethylovorans sp. PtaU1.Bin093]|uniref:hypothetical protein n=1 Tax=Methanomethylovorans sp. PtaU1.Bin093 TaxID=1811679 RepID=UPI0025E04AFD|nr:hypothetical protein [Methanomethylovorans sp. PtaU1.Bin093]
MWWSCSPTAEDHSGIQRPSYPAAKLTLKCRHSSNRKIEKECTISTQKRGVTIEYDEWLNALLDVYKFRIAVLRDHLSSMSMRSEADECEYHRLGWQLSALQESFESLEALGVKGRLREEKKEDQYNIPLMGSDPTVVDNIK